MNQGAGPELPAQANIRRATALAAEGNFEGARRVADECEARSAGGADAAMLAAAELIRGIVSTRAESLATATSHYEKALDAAQRAGDVGLVAKAFDALADTYFTRGQWDRVLALVDRLAHANDEASRVNRGLYLLYRAQAYSWLSEPKLADVALTEAFSLAEASHNRALLAQLHMNRGLWTWRYKRDLKATMSEYDQALADAKAADAWQTVVAIYNVSGNPFRNPSTLNPPEALRRYQAGLSIARREHLTTAHLLKNVGETYRLMGDHAKAEQSLQQAAAVADKYDVEEIRWMSRLGLAEMAETKDPALADQYFRQCLELLDAQQNDVLLEDFRAGTLAGAVMFADPYDAYLDFLMSQGKPEQAFLVGERQRARVFLDSLAGARTAMARDLPAGYSDTEQKILTSIKTAQAALRAQGLADDKRRALAQQAEREETNLTALRLRLAVERPALAHARFPKLLTVSDVQSRLLQPDEALLNFYLGAKHSYAWLITRDGLITFTLPARRPIEDVAGKAIAELRDPAAHFGSALAALSRALLVDEIRKKATAKHLIVVPSGILYDVPFEALIDGSGHPLVEQFATSYIPSAASLGFLRTARRTEPAQSTLIAVANPIVSSNAAASTRMADIAHTNLLAPVPRSSEEAHEIASMFEPDARVLEGKHATRSELQTIGFDRARILHFATHGLVDEDRPERSGLVLSANPPADDGLLQTRDIYGLQLNADLVTLSACETALGRRLTGEGMVGMTRAFFYAGSRAVVSSLWDVEDVSTARLMESFYANLRDGQPIDVALQNAKIALMRAGGATSRPFYWGAFIVTGQARAPIPIPPLTWMARVRVVIRRAWPFLVLALFVSLALGYSLRRPRASAAGA